jgi:hypothetical protein
MSGREERQVYIEVVLSDSPLFQLFTLKCKTRWLAGLRCG